MSKIYKGHNSKITSTSYSQLRSCRVSSKRRTNCRVKGEFPMDGKCRTMDAVYDCCVTSPEPQKIYFELPERKWKDITIKTHIIANEISMRQHLQVMFGI